MTAVQRTPWNPKTRLALWAAIIALAAAVTTIEKTSLGADLSILLGAVGQERLALRLLTRIEAVNRGKHASWRAHRCETGMLMIRALHQRGTWEDARKAAMRWYTEAQETNDRAQMFASTFYVAWAFAFDERYAEAVRTLDAALARHPDNLSAGKFESWKVDWLVRGGEYEDAIRQFEHFARYHADYSPGALRAVEWTTKAFKALGRTQEGIRRLKQLALQHDSDALGRAIQECLRNQSEKPTWPREDASQALSASQTRKVRHK